MSSVSSNRDLRAEVLGHPDLRDGVIDGDDELCSAKSSALDDGEPDPAAAEDKDGVAGLDFGGEEGGADAGGDGATDESGGLERDVVADFYAGLAGDDGMGREGGEAAVGVDVF